MKMVSQTKIILILALMLGLFMRGYQARERFLYTHDSDLSAWIVKDIVVDRHPRLIGQLTSQPGIFIGPLFYYSLIPFYLVSGMDPVGTLGFGMLLGIAAIGSIYYVFKKMFGPYEAGIASLIYALSWGIAGSEREIVPTAPVSLWTIWFFYAVNLVFKGDKKGLWLAAILTALIWHLNLALILLLPLIVLGIFINRSKYSFRQLVTALILTVGLSLPLIVFESRHNFSQTRALVDSLLVRKEGGQDLVTKFERTLYLSGKNINLMFWNKPDKLSFDVLAVIVVVATIGALYVRKDKYLTVILTLWTGLYILFFSLHSIIVSEYYLHGVNIVWIIGVTLALASLRKFRWIVVLVLVGFGLHNINYFLSSNINRIGYLEKRALISYIKQDAASHNYPCIAVSYITNPGYELGYRYLFWMEGMHVNRPLRESPVYSIVFPHTRVDRLNKTFGALGLITPDYSRYTVESVESSCQGENENLTEPMFGFTK
jgi:4-amino-4-deoxy-L-arabinose transferase-like glycosyltransferase